MKIGLYGSVTGLGKELVYLGASLDSESECDCMIFCAEPPEDVPAQANLLFLLAKDFNKPIVYVSSGDVFSGRRWFWKWGYKERSIRNPVTPGGWANFGAEAIAMVTDNVKIVRCLTDKRYVADAIIKFVKRFDEMPKILHISKDELWIIDDKKVILNSNLAKKLGIL